MTDELFMQRCLELALFGISKAAPNPMVGAVIVRKGKIIAEGWHQQYGKEHAEVNAINKLKDKSLLKDSSLYINLEPCCHYGKTQPCTDLILKYKIPKVIIGCADPFPEVNGKGINILRKNGVKVVIGILESQCAELNRSFFTFHQKKRPYIILKWAETADGFIQNSTNSSKNRISNIYAQRLSHKWRSEEQAIMIGTNTAKIDNPQLNVRHWKAKNPIRLVIDKTLRLPKNLHLFDNSIKTIVFTAKNKKEIRNLNFVQLDFKKNIIPQILKYLYSINVQSVIVEGGKQLLGSFIEHNCWDEARIFVGNEYFKEGLKSPQITGKLIHKETIGDNKLLVYKKNIAR